MTREKRIPLLVARIAGVVCAFPVDRVVETMRPGAVADGVTLHRGERVPVVDAARMLGASEETTITARRCVVVRAGASRASVIVDEVLGVERIEVERVIAMKALFASERIDELEHELRAVLASVRVMEAARA